jgi:Zn finger protein HypA/HybF involved in hydrogenase expression
MNKASCPWQYRCIVCGNLWYTEDREPRCPGCGGEAKHVNRGWQYRCKECDNEWETEDRDVPCPKCGGETEHLRHYSIEFSLALAGHVTLWGADEQEAEKHLADMSMEELGAHATRSLPRIARIIDMSDL